MATYSSFKRITTDAITTSAVTGAKIGSLQVTTDKLDTNSVRTTDIQDQAVGTNQLSNTLDFSGKTMTYRPFVDGDFANGSIAAGNLAAGAITTNLGYTPLNRAGDTLSGGNLKLADGTAGSPAIVSSNNTNTGIYFPGANQMNISTSGGNLNQLQWDGNDINHRQSAKPAFYCSGSGGWYYANSFGGAGRWAEVNNLQSGGGFTWNVTQQGGNNCSTNGRFTAPVSGWYDFYAQTYWYSDANNSNGYTHWNIGYNGSPSTDRATGRTPHSIYAHGTTGNFCPGISTSLQIYLNTGDYTIPQPYWGGGAQGRMHGDHSLWCGYLIG